MIHITIRLAALGNWARWDSSFAFGCGEWYVNGHGGVGVWVVHLEVLGHNFFDRRPQKVDLPIVVADEIGSNARRSSFIPSASFESLVAPAE